jgi:LIM domain/Protein DA1
MKCEQCRKTIQSEYLEVDGYLYHKECFICAKCNQLMGSSFRKHRGNFYHPHCYKEKVGLVCHACSKILEDKWVEDGGKRYHPQCVQKFCDICRQQIQGDYFKDKEGQYHESCYLNRKAPRCCVCEAPIKSKYILDKWGNKAHRRHNGRKINSCDYCSRIISNSSSNGGFKYGDGRHVCGICKLTSVEDNRRIHYSMMRVLKILSAAPAYFSGIPGGVPIKLVDRPTLTRLSGLRPDQGQGFTLSDITTRDGKRIKIKFQIFILNGMPQLQFESVLAHELLHVWLIQKEIKLPHIETEGFCNLGAELVYSSENSNFAQHLLQQLEQNPDRVYGGGYRKMKKRLKRIGWQRLKASFLN